MEFTAARTWRQADWEVSRSHVTPVGRSVHCEEKEEELYFVLVPLFEPILCDVDGYQRTRGARCLSKPRWAKHLVCECQPLRAVDDLTLHKEYRNSVLTPRSHNVFSPSFPSALTVVCT